MLELHFLEGALAGETVRMNFETAWFGRQPTCDFVLAGDGISRVHFSIVRRGQEYVLIDNNSTNGTFVNRLRTKAVTLKPGYTVAAGSCVMQVREVAADPSATPFRFVIEEMGGDAADARNAQVFEQTSLLLGRKTICHVQLNEPDVSPVHAELTFGADGLTISDQSAGAGVHVNSMRVVKQSLKDGDSIYIRPFEIFVSLKQGMCILRIRRVQLSTAMHLAMAAPGAPAAKAKSVARPSDNIAALPSWQQEKAPIYVPSSDILPNRARTVALVLAFLLVAGGTAFAWVFSKNFFHPGPIVKGHADGNAECSSCHTAGFARVGDAGCQGCHQDYAPAKYHSSKNVACARCHTEHQGTDFDFTRSIGGTCQSAGCHGAVHETLKSKLTDKDAVTATFEAVFLGEKDKGKFELTAGELKMVDPPAGNVMHKKHADKGTPCETCHATEDSSPRNAIVDAKGQVTTTGVSRKVRRERCLVCHGFGQDASLQMRCIGCHFEHPADGDKTARFLAAAAKPGPLPAPGQGSRPILILLFPAMLAALPLIYFTGGVFGIRRDSARAQSLAAAAALSARPVSSAPNPGPARPPAAGPPPKAQLRPQINLDLCVGCASCVHACPFNVLEIIEEKAIAVRMDDCTGYAACAAECPTEAIVLVDQGAQRTQELPTYDDTLETNVPGLYLAGEVTGKALIKVAINQGRSVVDSILRNRPEPSERYDVIVVGAGPAGTSTSLAAIEAGLRVLTLEQGTTANTIRSYPRQKFVMAEPVMIPLAGPLWMEDSSKESLLERWNEIIQRTGLVINEAERVIAISRKEDGSFTVRSDKGEYAGSRVVVAIGRRGSPRKLGIPGEDAAKVAYNLVDAEAYKGKSICIVGGGDSGIEAANGLARPDLGNRVVVVHRSADFSSAKARNQKKIRKSIDGGLITAAFSSALTAIGPQSVVVKTPQGEFEIPNDFVFVMVGGENPKKFLSQCGIEFSQRSLN